MSLRPETSKRRCWLWLDVWRTSCWPWEWIGGRSTPHEGDGRCGRVAVCVVEGRNEGEGACSGCYGMQGRRRRLTIAFFWWHARGIKENGVGHPLAFWFLLVLGSWFLISVLFCSVRSWN
ncbi:hypothetical protein P154DRAFT_351272 [Amniculicola lignicola CBS 123094]|uniref:Transmembrane protein n=1 Tax=Amniculicola lignicola CBS 123094 TaxID=1392246 RepID=A0A6A5X287_9PLEO|nr:hypothetical protein P154DRAFT_351272 [Amniculicola lignicola CBS 123094]